MENKGLDWFVTKICHAKDLASQSYVKIFAIVLASQM